MLNVHSLIIQVRKLLAEVHIGHVIASGLVILVEYLALAHNRKRSAPLDARTRGAAQLLSNQSAPQVSQGKHRRVQRWLARNKIYFETVAATALTMMSIAVAAAALVVAIQTRDVYTQQNELTRLQGLPTFSFSIRFSDYNSHPNAVDHLYVSNENANGPAREFAFQTFAFVEATFLIPPGRSEVRRVALYDYYDTQFLSSGVSGQLGEAIGISAAGGNNELMIKLLQDLRAEIATAGRGDVLDDSFTRYVQVSYTDRWGTRRSEPYRINAVPPSTRIDDNAWGELMNVDRVAPHERLID